MATVEEIQRARRKFDALRRMTTARGCTPEEADTARKLAEALAKKWGFPWSDMFEERRDRGAADDAVLRRAREFAEEMKRRAEQAFRSKRARAEADAEAARRAAEEKMSRAERQAKADAEAGEREFNSRFDEASRKWHWEYRKCGKSNCWCANDPKGHGPYKYSKKRTGKTVRTIYRGR